MEPRCAECVVPEGVRHKVNGKLRDHSGIAPLVNNKGFLITSDIDRAEL